MKRLVVSIALLLSSQSLIMGVESTQANTIQKFIRAVQQGQIAQVRQMLDDKEVDINVLYVSYGDNHGNALNSAVGRNRPEIVDLLIKRGINLNVQNSFMGHTPLMNAISHGNLGLVRKLLLAGADMRSLKGVDLDHPEKEVFNALDMAENYSKRSISRDTLESQRNRPIIYGLLIERDEALSGKR